MSREKCQIKSYVSDIAIVENDKRETALLDLTTNQIIADFDSFFGYEICYNRLISQYKLNGIRLFDIKSKQTILENASTIIPYKIYKTPDGLYHLISYFEAFDTLTHKSFQEIREVRPGFYYAKGKDYEDYYDLETGFLSSNYDIPKIYKK